VIGARQAGQRVCQSRPSRVYTHRWSKTMAPTTYAWLQQCVLSSKALLGDLRKAFDTVSPQALLVDLRKAFDTVSPQALLCGKLLTHWKPAI